MDRSRILLAVSGGIAAYKVPELVRLLDAAGLGVRCALTAAAARFVSPLVLQTLTREPVRSPAAGRAPGAWRSRLRSPPPRSACSRPRAWQASAW